jgi:prepilin-type N-terminal cleavage/methylation domain-containing protein
MKNTQKGFTLIELLVVIAIIGILSSIVIASLNSARTKGAVSAAKSGAAQLRTQSEVYYDGLGLGAGYSTSTTGCFVSIPNAAATAATGTAAALGATGCMFADTTVISQMRQMSANTASYVIGNVSTDGQKWAVSTVLKGSGNVNYCVDNSGNTKEQSTATVSQTTGVCS